jgi:hypothetical protein
MMVYRKYLLLYRIFQTPEPPIGTSEGADQSEDPALDDVLNCFGG